MKAKIVITLDGQISIVTQEGSFEEGKARIESLLAKLEVQGININLTNEVEQHRHDEDGNTVSGHVHSH